jgi:hypothetical protein
VKNRISTLILGLCLIPASVAISSPTGSLSDEAADPSAFQTPGASRLAAPVVVRFDDQFVGNVDLTPQAGGKAEATSDAPDSALRRFSLGVARRHFEDAKWASNVGKGRELVIKSVGVSFYQGPSYQVKVTVDRVQDGHRLGQSQGTGMAQADHAKARAGAAWAPGPWGAAATHNAMKPNPTEDAPVIQTATIRALDTALNQLGAVWANEQQADAIRAQNQAAVQAARKH